MSSNFLGLEQAFREYWGTVVGALASSLGDWDLAEECAQEAFATAATAWAETGQPESVAGWLIRTARNRAIDRLRRDANYAQKLQLVGAEHQQLDEDGGAARSNRDDRLGLIFACCHPDLPAETSICLTLRYLCGIRTSDLARAFVVSEEAMAKRLTRGKKRIRDSGITISVPPDDQLEERLETALRVLYQLFTEGYTTNQESPTLGLRSEAIFLTRYLVQMFPSDAEIHGLLSLMLFQDARSAARLDRHETLVPLAEQNRSHVDGAQVEEARSLLQEALALERMGPYQLQAAIAACHAEVGEYAETDWVRITSLYGQLLTFWDTPVVHLNRIMAMSNLMGPQSALVLFDQADSLSVLGDFYLFHAARADLLRRNGRAGEAITEYHRAARLASKPADQRFLRQRLEELDPAYRRAMS